jgi:hypothetical protein
MIHQLALHVERGIAVGRARAARVGGSRSLRLCKRGPLGQALESRRVVASHVRNEPERLRADGGCITHRGRQWYLIVFKVLAPSLRCLGDEDGCRFFF